MLRSAWNAFRSWSKGNPKRRGKKPASLFSRRTRLCLEPLERREVPASLLWVGPANGTFSAQNNWVNEASGVRVAPAAGDNLDFNPAQTNFNQTGANTAAVDDEPAAFAFGNITLDPAFTATVTIAQRAIMSSTVTLAGGTLQSAAGATVTIGGNLIQNDGTLAGTWQIGSSAQGNSFTGAMTIQLNANIQNPVGIVLNAALTVNNGTLTWPSGDVETGAQAALTINANTTFTIAGDASMTAELGVPNFLGIYNSGTIRKTVGDPTKSTHFDGGIENEADTANLWVSAGWILCGSGITQTEGLIQLTGGNISGGFDGTHLLGGTLTGVGTIEGDVINGDPTGQQQGAGTVRPGLNGSGGTLNITGNFTQTWAGMLQIDVNNGTTGLGVLNVGGTASLDGDLYIHRNPAYTPTRGTSLTCFTFTGGANGTGFASFSYDSQFAVWTDPQNNNWHDQFTDQPGQNAYTLLVIGVSM